MDSLTVETKQGVVRGTMQRGARTFLGIPYAVPPVGTLRFGAPLPYRWDGVLQADKFGRTAVQPRAQKLPMGEDCLTLNIWAPPADGKKRAVMFFLHGGSFSTGSSADPELNGVNLALDGDVVVVTANYRLGVLGFMDFSFLSGEFVSNCGLRDVITALRWTHENIAAFGGDPENITAIGQSAGATICSVLSTIPEGRRYISKIIMMSGGPTLLQDKTRYQKLSEKFLEYAGISTKEQLLALPAERIAELQGGFISRTGLGAGTFMMEVDGGLIPEYPIPAALEGETGIPRLIGTTREEMSFYFIKPLARRLEIDGIMNSGVGAEGDGIKQDVVDAYARYGKRGPSMMLSDLVFRLASTWFAEACSVSDPTWMYCFDYHTPAMRVSGLNAFHSSDIPFVFGNFRKGLGKYMFIFSPSLRGARRVYREMQGDFTSFAKTGSLPWERCCGAHTPGRVYSDNSKVDHMIAPDIKELYMKTNFRERSFKSGIDQNDYIDI